MLIKSIRGTVLFAALLGALAVHGCGGGGAATGPTTTKGAVGTLRFTILFPPPLTLPTSVARAATRFSGGGGPTNTIPLGTNVVMIRVTDLSGTDLAQPQVIPRPDPNANPQPVADATFASLPVENVQVLATAYADASLLEPLASGTVTATIVENSLTTAHVPLTLNGPPTSVSIMPGLLTLNVNASPMSGTLTASVQRASNVVLPGFPVQWTSSDSRIATVTYDPTNSAIATVNAMSSGTVSITATEVNTGLMGTATVTVQIIAG